VKTFAIGFAEDAASNELDDARAVARRLGTEHHELLTSAVDHPDLLNEVLHHQEEPVADLSGLGFLLLSRLTREHVTVALCGQGADELLGGYRKHQIAAAAVSAQRAPRAARRLVARLGSTAPAGSTLARGLDAVTTDDPVQRLLAMSRVVQAQDRSAIFTADFLREDGEHTIAAAVAQHVHPNGDSPLGETCYLDTRLGLVDNMLLYFDKLSMAASLEVRVPFLDHELVEFCHSLPDDRRVRLGRRKELLKRASAGLVDESIINKKKRGFFHSALGAWATVHRDGLVRDVLLDPRARERGLFRPDAVTAMVTTAGEEGKKADQRMFSMLLLELWHRFYVDGDGPGRRSTLQSRS
jgi:asparagine synthase (glutamine-hydrolysing)